MNTPPSAQHPSTSEHQHPVVNAEGRVPRGARALVLGGGGSTGNAWLIGISAGLFEAGVDVTAADLVIGSSAGATAAAQLTAAAPSSLCSAILTGPVQPRPQPSPHGPRKADTGRRLVGGHLDQLRAIIDASRDAADMRRRIGAAARNGQAPSGESGESGESGQSAQARWRATVEGRLPGRNWPSRPILITAVDADSGDGVAFDRRSGVELADAVAASCSNGFGSPAYRIGPHRYLDGGYRRNENADLAAGYGRVLVFAPLGGRSLHPPEWRMQLAAQTEELEATGSRVEVIVPDRDAEQLFGVNAMDLSLRPAAARAGHSQGVSLAARLADFWRPPLTR